MQIGKTKDKSRLFLRGVIFFLGIVLVGVVLLERPKVSEAALMSGFEERLNEKGSMIEIQTLRQKAHHMELLVKELATYPEILNELPRSFRDDLRLAVNYLNKGDREAFEMKLLDLAEKDDVLGAILLDLM